MGRVYLSPLLKRGDILKVPIRYKSSDRYNAGVDVVYNDGSKLQYPPFVYATTASGDSGGEDEEGEETMFVNITADESTGYATMDKTFGEIKDAVDAGKLVMFKQDDVTSVLVSIETGSDRHIYYYNETNMRDFVAASDTDYPKMELGG